MPRFAELKLALWSTVMMAATASPVMGQEVKSENDEYPFTSGDVVFRLGYNGSYASESPRIESHDTFLDMVASPELLLSKRLSIDSELRIETLRPPSDDRYFEEQGFFVRSLFARYAVNDRLTLHGGKYTPSFALASFAIPGMFGNDFNKEIELIERIGLGGAYTWDAGAAGKHKLSANTFFADTSFLSDSLGASPSRGRNSLEDGGASNTESFDSFTVSIEGTEISRLPGFTYKLGFVHEANPEADVSDENGFAVAAMQSIDLGERQSLTLIGEFAPLWNFDGTNDEIIYSSAGVVYQLGRWTMIASGTYRWREVAGGGTFDDYSIQTSVEYDLNNGLSLALAHEFTRVENADDSRIGFRFSKVLEW